MTDATPRPRSTPAAKAGMRIKPSERDAIISSLRAGMVPRTGQQHIQVGRVREVTALLNDINRLADGGSGVRFIIGDYGSGKSFFLQLIRSIAMQQKLVTVSADLSPDRRLFSRQGLARGLYAELMQSMATKASPNGGALEAVIERFISTAVDRAERTGTKPINEIDTGLRTLKEFTSGHDFALAIQRYWQGYESADQTLKENAIRWLRGEFVTVRDARKALGVSSIIDDEKLYDGLKLTSRFVRLAGYGGLLVTLDEMVNLFKLTHTKARQGNYEKLLQIVNDATQGNASGLGFVFAGTPEFLTDERRGLYSYEALKSRLKENAFARDGLIDDSGPVLRLDNLTPEDMLVLLQRLRHVQALGDTEKYLVPDDALHAFMRHAANQIGEAYFRSPRNTIKTFLDLLAVLQQNPGTSWESLLGTAVIEDEHNPDLDPIPDVEAELESAGDANRRSSADDGLTTFDW